jgi:hypothetical protein
MGMKYRVTESTVRKAVREAILMSPSDRWTLNEGFISMFFNALANTLDDLKGQYEIDSQKERSAVHLEMFGKITNAIREKLEKSGAINRQDSWNFSLENLDWDNDEIVEVVAGVLEARVNQDLPAAVKAIQEVSRLPAMPGLDEKGKPKKQENQEDQKSSIEADYKTQAEVIKKATKDVARIYEDIAVVTSSQPEAGALEAMLESTKGAFGSTAVDFLHKMKSVDTVMSKTGYLKQKSDRLGSVIEAACKSLSNATKPGLDKYKSQGNYKDGIAETASPSSLIKQPSSDSGEGKGEKK